MYPTDNTIHVNWNGEVVGMTARSSPETLNVSFNVPSECEGGHPDDIFNYHC